MSRVTVFQSNIDAFAQRNALSFGGTTIKGVGRQADRIGDRMVAEARQNARTMFNRRTGELIDSVVKIHEVLPNGAIKVGVGTTSEHGGYLEHGAEPHGFGPGVLGGRAPYLLRSGGPKDRPPEYGGPWPGKTGKLLGARFVQHPGNPAFHWLRDAVNKVRVRGV